MRLLVVFCHPDPESYAAAILDVARRALIEAGHELRVIDLYREGFDPVLSLHEKRSYLVDTATNRQGVEAHVSALQWAQGWVVIYPTWYYGAPAMLKGWLERVWLPGVTFELPPAKQRAIRGKLQHIRWFVGITTSGSPWWWLKLIGDPGRSLFMKGLRPLYAPRCRMQWLQLYDIDHSTPANRDTFLADVRTALRRGAV